jgi:hypothetical protein
MLGFETLRDLLEIIMIPLLLAALALWWPSWQDRQRRASFQKLVRTELAEARPRPEIKGTETKWTMHLTKRFLHERIITQPESNTAFVLSLRPELSYNLMQLWTAWEKGRAVLEQASADQNDAAVQASRWCNYLRLTCQYLDRPHTPLQLEEAIWKRWHGLLEEYYPSNPDAPACHLPRTAELPSAPRVPTGVE